MGRRREIGEGDILVSLLALTAILGAALYFVCRFLIKMITLTIICFKGNKAVNAGRSYMEPSKEDIKGNVFLERAFERERVGDFLGARVEYMKCIEDMKSSEVADSTLQHAKGVYAAFVSRDPFYAALLQKMLPVIKSTPGMLQSEITKHFAQVDSWMTLYNYNRPVSKDDIRYVLYFAEEQGVIVRRKKGRSYELYDAGDTLAKSNMI